MKKNKLAIVTSCMLIYGSFASIADAEEAKAGDTTLDEVVVTDTQLNPLKIPVKMTVITEEEIKAKGAQTVAEALKDVAGLTIAASNVKGKGVGQIRGSDASSTKVIIDGVMIGGGGDGRADLSVIPTDNIERIEIIKGPVPVMYGTNAPGGVIFITTKNPSGKSSGALTIARGSWDTERYSLSLSGSADKVTYYFGAKTESTDGYSDNPDKIGGFADHTAEKSDFYNGKLRWELNPDASLTVFGSYSNATKELPNRYGVHPSTGVVGILNYPTSGGTLTSRNNYWGGGGVPGNTYNWAYEPIKESYVGAVYNHKLNDANDLSLKVYRSTLSSLLTTESTNPLYGYQSLDWDGSINGYELEHTIKTSRQNAATWGYSYETRSFVELTPFDSNPLNGIPDGPYNRGDYDYTGKSFYIQDVTNLNNRMTTSFGYRHNEIDDGIVVNTRAYPTYGVLNHFEQRGTYSSDDPVFTVNYMLSENTFVHGSLGKSFRAPTAMERSAPDASMGTPVVLPEEGLNRELGLATKKAGIHFDVTCFSRDITNMIKGGGNGGGRTQYYNIPDVDMHGYEAEATKKFNKHLKGFWNYSYTNAYDTRVGTQVSDVPTRKHSYGLNFTDNGVTANLAVNYVGARRTMYSQGNGNGEGDGNQTINYGSDGNWMFKRFPGYRVVDLKVSKAKDDKEYYIKILNLFDKQYYTGSYLVAPDRYVEVGTTVKF